MNYLTRGLALYYSLREHCQTFRIWVLCMDNDTFDTLLGMQLPGMRPISLEEFESGDKALLAAKQNRSRIEYYFTCTPSLLLFVLRQNPDIELITYLDADLFFFADPAPIFVEIDGYSIGIIGHRFPEKLRHLEEYGIYNVGWLSFRRDQDGHSCLNWWRERCIEWCHDRIEDGKFADQKYLDDWPERFYSVKVIQHKGANLAPWNLDTYPLSQRLDKIIVDDQKLLFFHFHNLKQLEKRLYEPNLRTYEIALSRTMRLHIYKPYIRVLRSTALKAACFKGRSVRYPSIRYSSVHQARKTLVEQQELPLRRALRSLRRRWHIYCGILQGRYIYDSSLPFL